MARLRVPDAYRSAFEFLAKLDESAATQAIEALASAPAANPNSLYEIVSASSDHISAEEAEVLVDALISLHMVRQSDSDLSAQRIAEDVSLADDLELPDVNRAKLAERLSAMLETSAIDLMSRAHDLSSEQDKTLTDVKIVSDIRPIFGPNAEERPAGAIVAHTLRLTYFESGQYKTFSLALDSDDLRTFKEAVERSLTIDRSLKKFLTEADLKLLDVDEQ